MRLTVSMARLLVAAALTSASWAGGLPFIADLEERTMIETRDSSKCPSSYESQNGMNFTTYCNMNIAEHDAYGPFIVASMQECMERCSRYWGDGEGCFGIVYNEVNQCYLKNSTVTASTTNETGTYSALVQSSDMEAGSTTCPYDDLSTHSLGNGLGWTFHCDKSVNGYDGCFDGYPSCLGSPFIGFYHTDNLEDCIDICVKEHPLCLAVTYNPGLEIGFANCWPKTGFPSQLTSPTSNQGTFFTATITSIDTIDNSCPNSSYTATGDKGFDVHCGQSNQGTNITSVHRQNMTSCMDDCAGTQDCVGVVFDSTLAGGYDNCYLQNTTSIVSKQANATYAQLSGTSIPTSSSSASSGASAGSNGKSSSKAWIAGPVIGGIAAVALIAGALLWWRRRRNTPKTSDYARAPAYSSHSEAAQLGYGPPGELSGRQVEEMENNEVRPAAYATKYAHQDPPQELPT